MGHAGAVRSAARHTTGVPRVTSAACPRSRPPALAAAAEHTSEPELRKVGSCAGDVVAFQFAAEPVACADGEAGVDQDASIPTADQETADGKPCLPVAVEQVAVTIGGGVVTEVGRPRDERPVGDGVTMRSPTCIG